MSDVVEEVVVAEVVEEEERQGVLGSLKFLLAFVFSKYKERHWKRKKNHLKVPMMMIMRVYVYVPPPYDNFSSTP